MMVVWVWLGGCSVVRIGVLKDMTGREVPVPGGARMEKLEADPFFERPIGTVEIVTPMAREEALGWYRQTLKAQGWKLMEDWDTSKGWGEPFEAERQSGSDVQQLRLRT